jgi:hypothetical protein
MAGKWRQDRWNGMAALTSELDRPQLAYCVETLFGGSLRQRFGGLQTINSLPIIECARNSDGPTF